MKKIGRLDRPDNYGSATLFSNPVLERISRTHISIPITLFLAISTVSMYYGLVSTSIPLGLGLAFFGLGLLTFSFVEYMMHKHFFHMEPDTPLKDKLQYNVHGVHHDYPKDKDRLAMPPFVSAAYAAILYLLFRLVMGDFALYFLPGFLLGYAGYLGVHYVVHVYTPPRIFSRSCGSTMPSIITKIQMLLLG